MMTELIKLPCFVNLHFSVHDSSTMFERFDIVKNTPEDTVRFEIIFNPLSLHN